MTTTPRRLRGGKSVWVHAGVLIVASGLALSVWSSDEKETAEPEAERVEVWGGSPDSLETIRFEGKDRTVVIDAKKDAQGRYYVAKVDKTESAGPKHDPHDPHAPPRSVPDAGAPTPGKRTTVRFIGVKAADELAKQLAPLEALRRIGPIEPKRAEEFGLDKPEGTLKVKIDGKEHALVIGGTTPGGNERYAKEVASGSVYAVPGDIAQGMLGAESRLLERELHGFEEGEVTRVRVTKRDKSRELVTVEGKKGSWADLATPTKVDETAGNWISKVDRLRVQEYVEVPSTPLKSENAVVRVEYLSGSKPLGYVELFKAPGGTGNEYFVRSERTRWAAKVLTSAGEQVDQDLGSVLK
jgi:hypothetical protein